MPPKLPSAPGRSAPDLRRSADGAPQTVMLPRGPHAATVVQAKRAWPRAASYRVLPPHPATVGWSSIQAKRQPMAARVRGPHPVTISFGRERARAHAGPVLQRMELPQKCSLCGIKQSESKPAELCLVASEYFDGDAPHEWINDYDKPATSKPTHQSAPKQTLSVEKPARYEDAQTWLGVRTLIAPFATRKLSLTSSAPPSTCCSNFVSCAPTPRACEELCDTPKKELERCWSKLRTKVLGDIGFKEIFGSTTKKYLTHTGLLRAQLFLEGKGQVCWTFYASAANVCIVKDRVVHLITGETQSSSGSCHSEQLCMYWLHDELATLIESQPIKVIQLDWFTELPMCGMWCIPTLQLFTVHWRKLGVQVVSNAFQVAH